MFMPTRIWPMPDGMTVHSVVAGDGAEGADVSDDAAGGAFTEPVSVAESACLSTAQAPATIAVKATRTDVRTLLSRMGFAKRTRHYRARPDGLSCVSPVRAKPAWG
jgi:hypothetical protein